MRFADAEPHGAEEPGEICREETRFFRGRNLAPLHHVEDVVGAHDVGLAFLDRLEVRERDLRAQVDLVQRPAGLQILLQCSGAAATLAPELKSFPIVDGQESRRQSSQGGRNKSGRSRWPKEEPGKVHAGQRRQAQNGVLEAEAGRCPGGSKKLLETLGLRPTEARRQCQVGGQDKQQSQPLQPFGRSDDNDTEKNERPADT